MIEEGFIFGVYLCQKEFNKFPDLQLTFIKKWRVQQKPSEAHTQLYYGQKLLESLLALSFTKLQRLFVELVVSNTNEMFQSAVTQWEKTCIWYKAKQNLINSRLKKPQFEMIVREWNLCLIIFPMGRFEEKTIFD